MDQGEQLEHAEEEVGMMKEGGRKEKQAHWRHLLREKTAAEVEKRKHQKDQGKPAGAAAVLTEGGLSLGYGVRGRTVRGRPQLEKEEHFQG